ncbi:MAG: ATP-binding cassette domain-containing protein [Leptospiraceae bacterium]|nr:ATP-binding cassette domain-containing protein [Leptospiraceae bacterium]
MGRTSIQATSIAEDKAALECRDLAVGYQGRPAITVEQLTLPYGQCIVLAGANGSGKSTLMHCLARIRPPLQGQIVWHCKQLAYVPQRQGHAADLPLTVADFVRLGKVQAHVFQKDRLHRNPDSDWLGQCLADLDLQALARQRIAALSAGQYQRALIARALYSCPDLLILDEPSASLDQKNTIKLNRLLQRTLARNCAVLLSTHDQRITQDLRGRTLAVGTDHVLKEPKQP